MESIFIVRFIKTLISELTALILIREERSRCALSDNAKLPSTLATDSRRCKIWRICPLRFSTSVAVSGVRCLTNGDMVVYFDITKHVQGQTLFRVDKDRAVSVRRSTESFVKEETNVG